MRGKSFHFDDYPKRLGKSERSLEPVYGKGRGQTENSIPKKKGECPTSQRRSLSCSTIEG